MFLAGLIVATFIDFEHFIIPDEITLGGMGVGLLCSWLVPGLQHQRSHLESLGASAIGLVFGAGLVYSILRLGKLVFGRQKLKLAQETRIVFGENAVQLPDREIAYEEVFYRPSDVIALRARTVELVDRCYKDVLVRLGLSQKPPLLQIGEEKLNPEGVAYLEAVSEEIVLPREAMGLGDVKFMGAIGAFLGWQAVLFSLVVSSFIGALVGVGLVVMRKRALSSRLPYGPYIAAAATIWMFAGRELVSWYGRFIGSIFAH
jgi:leader peptidase (prepilin peptidase)/N-methyltransferase